jgi:hypothetical protein
MTKLKVCLNADDFRYQTKNAENLSVGAIFVALDGLRLFTHRQSTIHHPTNRFFGVRAILPLLQ